MTGSAIEPVKGSGDVGRHTSEEDLLAAPTFEHRELMAVALTLVTVSTWIAAIDLVGNTSATTAAGVVWRAGGDGQPGGPENVLCYLAAHVVISVVAIAATLQLRAGVARGHHRSQSARRHRRARVALAALMFCFAPCAVANFCLTLVSHMVWAVGSGGRDVGEGLAWVAPVLVGSMAADIVLLSTVSAAGVLLLLSGVRRPAGVHTGGSRTSA